MEHLKWGGGGACKLPRPPISSNNLLMTILLQPVLHKYNNNLIPQLLATATTMSSVATMATDAAVSPVAITTTATTTVTVSTNEFEGKCVFCFCYEISTCI